MTKAEKDRARHLLKNYGLTLDDYEKLRLDQNYRCAICSRPESELSEIVRTLLPPRLHVDHDEMGVRGLLCSPCNTAIGLLQHDPEVIENAREYLLSNRLRRDLSA